MMVQGVSIGEMLNQSITVLTKPSVASFEQFEKHGGVREAIVYVGVAAAIAGVVAFIFSLFGGFLAALLGLIGSIAASLLGFAVFAYVLYWVGQQQGGTGTQDEVFYTVALYAAPIIAVNGAIGSIPLIQWLYLPVAFVLTLYQVYLAYIASRSSMNIDQNKAIISVVVAIVAMWLLMGTIGAIIGAGAIATGTVPTGTILGF